MMFCLPAKELPVIDMTFQSLLIASHITVLLAISLNTCGCILAGALPMCMSDWLMCSQILSLPQITFHVPRLSYQAQGLGKFDQALPNKK